MVMTEHMVIVEAMAVETMMTMAMEVAAVMTMAVEVAAVMTEAVMMVAVAAPMPMPAAMHAGTAPTVERSATPARVGECHGAEQQSKHEPERGTEPSCERSLLHDQGIHIR
jgi:hypothetical protein